MAKAIIILQDIPGGGVRASVTYDLGDPDSKAQRAARSIMSVLAKAKVHQTTDSEVESNGKESN